MGGSNVFGLWQKLNQVSERYLCSSLQRGGADACPGELLAERLPGFKESLKPLIWSLLDHAVQLTYVHVLNTRILRLMHLFCQIC